MHVSLPILARPIAGDLTGLVADLVTGQCYDTVLAGVEQGCLDSVAAGVVAQCDGAGGV